MRVVTALSALLALSALSFSGWQTSRQLAQPSDFQGSQAISSRWAAPPAAGGRWLVSDQVPPPAVDADAKALDAWLAKHYPALFVARHRRKRSAGPHALDLGGGPPRRLFLEAGVGLVMQEPEAWYAAHHLPMSQGEPLRDE